MWIGTSTDPFDRRILTKAETKLQRKYNSLTATAAAAGGDRYVNHALVFDEGAPVPMARVAELTATHHHTLVACVSVAPNWQFPIPVTHLTHWPRDAHAAHRCTPLPEKSAEDGAAETPSAVPTAGPWCEGRE